MWHPAETIQLFKNRELDELYVSIAVRRFALSVVSIFLPIYLLEQGLSIAVIFFFFAGKNLLHAAFVYPAAAFCARFGYKHGMAMSAPLIILFFILLYSLPLTTYTLLLLGIIHGAQTAFYYTGYHLDFTKVSTSTDTGRAIGVVKILSTVFHAAGPIIGGILLVFTSFHVMFMVVSAFLLLSAIPLFLTPDGKVPMKHVKLSEVDPTVKKETLAFWGYGFEAAASQTLWPFVIYLTIVGSYAALGGVVSLGIAVSAALSWMIGVWTDKWPRKVLSVGVFGTALAWIGRLFSSAPVHVYATDSVHGITTTAMTLPTEVLTYKRANKTDVLGFVMMREIAVQVGRASMYLLVALVGANKISLAIGAASTFLFFLF